MKALALARVAAASGLLGAAGPRARIWKSPWRCRSGARVSASSRRTALVIAPRAMVIMQRISPTWRRRSSCSNWRSRPRSSGSRSASLRNSRRARRGCRRARGRTRRSRRCRSARSEEARRQAGKTAQQEAREFQRRAADGGGLDLAGTRGAPGPLASAFLRSWRRTWQVPRPTKKPPSGNEYLSAPTFLSNLDYLPVQ